MMVHPVEGAFRETWIFRAMGNEYLSLDIWISGVYECWNDVVI